MERNIGSFYCTKHGQDTDLEDIKNIFQTWLQWKTKFGIQAKILLIDVDNTIRCSKQREHLMPTQEEIEMYKDAPNQAYAAFNGSAQGDTIITSNIDFIKVLKDGGYLPVFLTSCTYSRDNFQTLLNQLQYSGIGTDNIIAMRGLDNHGSPLAIKVAFVTLTGLTGMPEAVTVLDDNLQICDVMSKKFGFNSLNYRHNY